MGIPSLPLQIGRADVRDQGQEELEPGSVGGSGMATRHPGVWRWRVERCDRAQEIHATTCHTGCRQAVTMAFPYCSTSALSASSAVAMAACARSRKVA